MLRITADEIATLIAEGEGRSVEFKRGLQHDAKLARTLAAFANTRGGILLVGVGDRGELLGAPKPPHTLEHLRVIARERVDPPLEPPFVIELAEVRVGPKRVVACSVALSPSRPHAAIDDDGEREIVVRVGSSNRTASSAALDELRAPRRRVAQLDELEREVLAWLAGRPNREGTLAEFLATTTAGRQRVRAAFQALEHEGHAIAHGIGASRTYRAPAR